MDPQWMAQVTLPAKHTFLFTRHLAILFGAGVPLMRCLDILAEQADHPVLAEILWSLSKDIHGGMHLSSGCARYPRIFSDTYVSVLKVAEQTGQLHQSLMQLADWQERDEKQRQQLQSALTYPVVVLSLTLGLSLWLCWAILPGILQGLQDTNTGLPWPTRALMGFVSLLHQPLGAALIVGLLIGGVGSGYSFWRKPPEQWRRPLWRVLLRLPLLGVALRDSSVIRYCAACQVLLQGGADLLRSLRLAGRASGNPLLLEDQWRLRQAVEEAHSMSDAMNEERWLYGPLLPALVGGCEETGSLEPAFRRTREFLEEEVTYRFHLVQQAIEPVLLLILAALVLFFLLSVMLPLYAQLRAM
jgi:type II secretory pathway component PulF